MPEFNPYDIELRGNNMIEASAGTGKTFSVALLVVRLIAEKDIPVGRILMMTFTNAAVAELAERIRLFIRSGLACLESIGDPNPALERILVTGKNEDQRKLARDRLGRAILELDQLSILTIHSFCSKTISRFSFETGQAMGSKPIDNPDLIVSPLVDDFWRRNVATLDTSLLMRLLDEAKFKKLDLMSAVKEALGGKEYVFMNPEASIEDARIDSKSFIEIVREDPQFFIDSVKAFKSEARRNTFTGYLESGKYEDFADKIIDAWKNNRKYLNEIPDTIDVLNNCNQAINAVIQTLITVAVSEIVPKIEQVIRDKNLITYNDMIENMRKALEGNNALILRKILRDEYEAVFIDEFQDTDRSQLEIFRRTFMVKEEEGEVEKTVFLIGDPKQMIYAWRKADMDTYLTARATVGEDNVYQMKENFRSSKRMIEAMNLYFKETDESGIFLMGKDVRYIDVNYPASPKTKEELLDIAGKVPDVPIEISIAGSKKTVKQRMMIQLSGLIGVDACARIPDSREPGGYRKVKYSDIGILVRKNREASEIKSLLSRYGIPAIQIDDADIFLVDESHLMLYLIAAIIDRRPDNIRRVMFSSVTGLTYDNVDQLDMDKVTEIFKQSHDILVSKGVYSAVNFFLGEFRVRQYLIFESGVRGKRIYANMCQLLELLHQAESDIRLSPEELVIWLRKRISDSEYSEKAYELRLESDEDAVKIVTIHKSKGLEYNIIFAPFMNLKRRKDLSFRTYREDGRHFFVDKHNISKEQESLSNKEYDQENRRIMYVALTRAKYKAFLHRNVHDKGSGDSVIEKFILKIKSQKQAGDEFIWIRDPNHPEHICDPDTLVSIYEYSEEESKALRFPRISQFPRPSAASEMIKQREYMGEHPIDNWRRLSYSSVKSKSTEKGVIHEKIVHEEKLENFVFCELPKGAKTGNILHVILEKIDFTETDHSKWDPVIRDALDYYRLKGDLDTQIIRIREWIHHLLDTELNIGGKTFKLSEVPRTDLIPEFEFDFHLNEFQVADLMDAAGDVPIRVNTTLGTLKGIMNGKMDILFRYAGRYYILDWKTNHLGYTVEDYGIHQVKNSMEASNYNLQYLIYSVAARKYLASRIPSFDYQRDFGGVIYLFVRGVRIGLQTGIYTDKLDVEALNKFEKVMSASS
jgi:exodeoxyribonuclease V beta subunit